MTLSFKTHFDGNPTRFPEKIIKGLYQNEPIDEFVANAAHHAQIDLNVMPEFPKLHTIRVDRTDLWNPGRQIHMVINNRSKNRCQFASIQVVQAIQLIDILYSRKGNETRASVIVDGVQIGEAIWISCQLRNASSTLEKLIRNDGFDDVNEFFEFFPEDFRGKIIHWTSLTY